MATARQELTKVKARIADAEKAIIDLNTRLNDAKVQFSKREELEKLEQQETRDRKEADIIMSPARKKASIMEESMKTFTEATKPLIQCQIDATQGSKLESVATPLSVRKAADEANSTLIAHIDEATAAVQECRIHLKTKSAAPFQKAQQELLHLLQKADASTKKRTISIESVRRSCKALGASLLIKAVGSLRENMLTRDITAEALFSELAEGADLIPEKTLCKHLLSIESLGFSEEQAMLLTSHVQPGGISKRHLVRTLQSYMECIAKIAVTSDFDIKKGSNVRAVEAGEIVEVLEGPRVDGKLGMQRVRARALSDGIIGWISVKGTSTTFLADTKKPYRWCSESIPLEKDFKSSGSDDSLVRKLKADEVFELLEGPRLEISGNALRAKGKAVKDGVVGWFTVKSKTGEVLADSSDRYFVCVAPIAMTDMRDIKASKCMRKAAKDEVFLLHEGPFVDPVSSVSRMRCTSLSSDTSGWITVKGNQGTVFAEESKKHYTVRCDTAMQAGPESASAAMPRQLLKGEAVEILIEPREEKSQEIMRVKVCMLSDSSVGWVTTKTVKVWTSQYTCMLATPLQDSAATADSRELRMLDIAETVEVIDGPVDDPRWAGVLRVRVRAERDGLVGWVSIRSVQDQVILAVKGS